MKKKNKGLDLKTFILIVLAIIIGLSLAFFIFSLVDKEWTMAIICIVIAISLFLIACPLNYQGEIYECSHCGNKFSANPFKVFFTNGVLQFLNFDSSPTKYYKLKCPHCKKKDWCKRGKK